MTFDARETSVHEGQPFELFKFTMGARQWFLTSGDVQRSYLGDDYVPTAMKRTEMSQGLELKSGSIVITIPRDHEIAEQFLHYLPSSKMLLTIIRGHEGEAEVLVYAGFEVVSVKRGDDCELTVAPPLDILKRRIPPAEYQRRCNHVLYGPGCDVDKESFKTVATLTFVSGVTVKSDEFTALGTGWLDSGYLEKGNERRMILRHVGDTIELITAMRGLAVDDEVNVYAGCARTAAICNSKFSNLHNFLGFEFIPKKNPFNGVE